MAKISARGCHVIVKFKGPILPTKGSIAVSQDIIVLRSDGKALSKTNWKHRPGERWSQGSYTTYRRLSCRKWKKLGWAQRVCWVHKLRQYLTELVRNPYTEVDTWPGYHEADYEVAKAELEKTHE